MVQLQPDGRAPFQVDIAMIVLTVLAVALRFVARTKTKAKIKAADWLIVAAAAGLIAMNGAFLQGLLGSGGTVDLRKMDFEGLGNIYKYLYVVDTLFILNVSLIRFSILVFYYDIFSRANRPFKHATQVLAVLSGAWFAVIFCVNVFQCNPIAAAWDVMLVFNAKECINYGHFVIGYESTSMALDLGIIAACIFVVRGLQLSKAKMWFVSGIFALGGFVSVMCLVRIYYFTRFNWDYSLLEIQLGPLLIWSDAQLAVGIVCACIPCYGPLMPTQQITSYLEKWFSSFKPSQSREPLRMAQAPMATPHDSPPPAYGWQPPPPPPPPPKDDRYRPNGHGYSQREWYKNDSGYFVDIENDRGRSYSYGTH